VEFKWNLSLVDSKIILMKFKQPTVIQKWDEVTYENVSLAGEIKLAGA
jgi:hypothetical protein